MTVRRLFFVICDECGCGSDLFESAPYAREYAALLGWTRKKRPPGKNLEDLCPRCSGGPS